MAPRIVGMYINTPAYALPIFGCEANVTPSQIVRISTTPSTQPSKVVWMGVNPN